MSRRVLVAGTVAAIAVYASAAVAQEQGFVAHATVNVANNSPVPQTVTGTGVPPFELMPHQQAMLDMNVTPPPAPTAPGSSVPVQFTYNVGQNAGPQCHGTIDMSLGMHGTQTAPYEVTNCVSHSTGVAGASCEIAVKANNGQCQGALAFTAR
jgi:hypothetical protein